MPHGARRDVPIKCTVTVIQSGSQSYVPPDEKNDKALAAAFNQLRGVTVNADAKNADTKAAQKRPVPN
ncbi:hypothetical protein ACVW17_005348 [Bradyrhizobium sp. USDA 4473]